MIALKAKQIFTNDEVLNDHFIIVENSIVKKIEPSITDDCEIIDLSNQIIAPAFIDIQVNGGGGFLFNNTPDEKTLDAMIQEHQKSGVLFMLPTFITDTQEKMEQALEAVAAKIQKSDQSIIGIHIEGPFINSDKKGTHNPQYIRKLNADDVALLISYKKKIPTILVTLAPEINDHQLIKQLIDAGIIISIGHSNGHSQEILKAFSFGCKGATHLFNGMSGLKARDPGCIGATFLHREAFCGLIADMKHVHSDNIDLTLKLKKDRIILVSDAMHTTDMKETDATYYIEDKPIQIEEGVFKDHHKTLSGSCLSIDRALRNIISQNKTSLEDGLKMTSLHPAQFLGLDNKLGKIAPGYSADFVVFNDDITIEGIFKKNKFKSFKNME